MLRTGDGLGTIAESLLSGKLVRETGTGEQIIITQHGDSLGQASRTQKTNSSWRLNAGKALWRRRCYLSTPKIEVNYMK